MIHYLFDSELEMKEAFKDFVRNVRLVTRINANESLLIQGGIGTLSENYFPIKQNFKVMGINPYCLRSYNNVFCGVHVNLWCLYNFYGEFCKTRIGSDYFKILEVKYYAEILNSLEESGEVISFSLKEDFEKLKKRYKEFDYNFVFDVLTKDHLQYKNVNYKFLKS